jgi:hypothetical protein
MIEQAEQTREPGGGRRDHSFLSDRQVVEFQVQADQLAPKDLLQHR